MSVIRVALIGLDHWCSALPLAAGIAAHDGVSLAGVWDANADRARDVARRYGVARVEPDWRTLVDDAGIDAVMSFVSVDLNHVVCQAAAGAGKHIIANSPPARGGRGHRHVAFARVRSSHAGPAAGAWLHDPSWFCRKGAGPLFDMGIFGIHEITGILGPAQRVMALSGITERTRTVRGGPFQGKSIDVTADDNVLMMLDFGASTFAVIDGTFNVNASRGPKVEIFGREGTINLSGTPYGGDGPALEIYQTAAVGGQETWITSELPDARMRWLITLHRAFLRDHLADCVSRGAEPTLNIEHARHVLEIMLKADESARHGRAVELATTFSLPDPVLDGATP